MPTGGGKSICYQVPAAVADRTDVVVSPLISLMKDQVDALEACGYPAAALHSGLAEEEKSGVIRQMLAGKLRLLFVAPERLLTPGFLAAARRLNVRAFHIDEAHCISQWGHDFRPEYRRLTELRRSFPDASLHAFTATATPRVRSDIVSQLGLRRPEVLVGRFDRPNLNYQVTPRTDAGRQILEVLGRHQGEAAIIYCISRKDTEETSAYLRSRGIRAAAYHAGLTALERSRTQEAFAAERLDVVVATVAFGMGIDRSNVRCVIHAAMPKSVEHYQQETGRAGRDGLEAECVLLYSRADAIRWGFVFDKSEASPAVIAAQQALLRDMRNLCESQVCRHAALSRYFGQKYESAGCGACDVCVPPLRPAAPPDRARVAEDGWAGVDRDLFEQLRSLRTIVAGERGLPAYIVFSDATLRDLARIRPQTLSEMRRVRGIGERKLADLGQRFLDEVRRYCEEKGIPPPATALPVDTRQGRQPPLSSALNLTKRRAFDMFAQGLAVADIAQRLGRANATVAGYLSDYILAERPAAVSAWVSTDVYRRVETAARETGLERLKPIFDALGGEVSYDDIRIVAGHLRAMEGQAS
jgi:RecQ family ATP-dependent DNA helicase